LTLHGHAHPHIAQAIAKQASQLEQVIFAGFTHESATTLAKKLVGIAPDGLTKVFFSDDGSTAVEVALKMALQFWKHHGEERRTFLALEHAYHGDTFGAMSVSARSAFTSAFDPLLFNVKRLPFPEPNADAEERFLTELEHACKIDRSIAGFIFEPLLLGAGGMKTWRAAILREAIETARSHNVLIIADEVLNGFGRTGTMWAMQQTGVSPDLMTLSKGLTGGFLPMGITLARQSIFDAFLSDDRSKTFFHGHSYTGNPIACAAAVASLEIFETEPVMDRIKSIESVHAERMPQLADKRDHSYRILGTMAALEPKESTGYLNTLSLQLFIKGIEHGILIRPLGDVVYLLPPYSSKDEDLHRAYDILEALL
jgi:adenosylmethionine-8-amino-7-oxononanoate aminotransferase